MISKSVVVFVSFVLTFTLALKDDCSGPENTFPIWAQNPTFVRSVTNATLYTANAQPGNSLPILHVYGSAFEMGQAQGRLMKSTIVQLVNDFDNYLYDMIAPYIKFLPQDIQKIIEVDGVNAALDFTAELTRPYPPQHFFDELQGLAAGVDNAVSYQQLLRVNMFPELIKASCSMFGAWGAAIKNTTGTLYQLRALDFGTDSPLVNYSVLIVYHPTEGNSFVSVTWFGFVGSVTSYSGVMGVSEKVWLHYNETSSRAGIPFHFLIRDIAQFDNTLDDAFNRMINVKRTCSVFLGIGSNYSNEFRVVEYAHEELFIFDDKNFPAYLPAHPLMKGLVFVDKHTQPSDDTCLGSKLQQYYGNITPEITIRSIVGPFGTGDLHAAVYDYAGQNIYLSVAGTPISADLTPIPNAAPAPAYARPWFKFNLNALYSIPAPSA